MNRRLLGYGFRVLALFAVLMVLIGSSAAVAGARPAEAPAAADPTKQNGISFTAWWQGFYDTPEADRSLQALRDTGANWVSVLVTQYQQNLSATTIGPTAGTPTDAEVIATIQEAHRLGLKVMLKPHVDLWNDAAHWRGEIGAGYDETDWNAWFAEYRDFINHYAAIARDYEVEQLAVGVELLGTEHREAQWRQTITGVRAIYDGPVVYATSQGEYAMNLTWWDAVDFIGVDAYYELSSINNPTPTQLRNGWAPILTDLAALSAQWGNKKIIFPEVGYRSIDGANRQPWEWQSSGTVDLQEQVDLYEALMDSVYHQPWFAGMFLWDWSYDPFLGGFCDTNYTVHDKPAENVIRRWYGAAERTIAPLPEVNEAVSRSIYADARAAGWDDWSWGSTVNYSATNQVHGGQRSISVVANQAWAEFKLHHSGIDTTPYYYLEFWLRTNAAATELHIMAYDENDEAVNEQLLDDCRYAVSAPPQAQTWTRVRIPLDHLFAADKTITGFGFQVSETKGTFWLDDIRLVGAAGGSSYVPVTFAAAEDSYTSQTAPTRSFGNAKILRVKNAARDFNAYLKFNVSGLPAPIKKATLRLYATDGSDDGGAVYPIGNSWTEAGLTWNNAPAISGAPVAAGKPAAAKRWIEWDVTSVVSGEGYYHFALRTTSTNPATYSSSESSRPPQLVVEFGP